MSKERPILFSGPMIRAILEGRKTQTRRIVKPQPDHRLMCAPNNLWYQINSRGESDISDCGIKCPYGVAGDRLWVKETFRVHGDCGQDKASTCYCTGPKDCEFRADYEGEELALREWRPSIHMPRWASRITLEVTGVRVERLQDISEQDAIAEGAERNDSPGSVPDWEPEWGYRTRCSHYPAGCECFPNPTARDWFEEVWESINGEGSWDANPWVWVIEFKRIAQAVGT